MNKVQLFDALTLDAPRRLKDGYMVVRARAARAGIYDYLAGEPGIAASLPEGHTFKPSDVVKIYRSEDEVFAEDSVRSFLARPVTDNHPREAVNSDNWRRHARGVVMGAMRDKEYLAFDMMLTDSAMIDAVDAGKRELSNGYESFLDWTPGTTPDGQHYDARQTNIRGNHVAIVDRGRAGSNCAIKDGQAFAVCDANPAAVAALNQETKVPKTITLDGMPVNLGDEAVVEAAISKLQDTAAKSATALADANSTIETLTGEKTALETQLADAKAELDPAKLDARVADRAALVDSVKDLVPSLDCTGKTDAEIRKAVVEARLGDKAVGMSDGEVSGAFRMLVASADSNPTHSPVPVGLKQPVVSHDSAAVRDAVRASRY